MNVDNIRGLTEKLAQMNGVARSTTEVREVVFQTAWTIENFTQLMKNFNNDSPLEPKGFIIALPEGQEDAGMTVDCCPRDVTNVTVAATVTYKLRSPVTHISIGLLDRTGAERIWSTSPQITDTEHFSRHEASLSHRKLLAEENSLLPGGHITIFVKVTISFWSELEHPREPKENLFDAMLAKYVDFADASVLLVFADGEQRCHTFPLAAREE
jgi:hypothetical protein